MSNERTFRTLPNRRTTYANVAKSLLPNQRKATATLPKDVYSVPKLRIDDKHLSAYRQICGFINDGHVPATYFAVLSQTLQMNLMASKSFPFAMLGLVHLYNKVTQHRPILDTEVVKLSVHLSNLRAHDKGQQFDFVTKVTSGDELLWEGVSTYLSRQKTTAGNSSKPKTPPTRLAITPSGIHSELAIAEDTGRRYALVSGDFNPIHLHALTARAFGYPKALAHGMWLQARALAYFTDLPVAFSCEVWFKAPVLLPAEVTFIAIKEDNDWQFALYGKADRTHMDGSITPL